ncbi:unnamed protein product [Nippostrongylus brasiliensis]|uniref:DUF1713 domain-containing protein n=1 Tax=Nippostrongylus brasiliensis TaxID=27835 RepID=A0A0N4XF04_NIPBR|nr:unnamed protein product [Nippostrongylus brasiliensis]
MLQRMPDTPPLMEMPLLPRTLSHKQMLQRRLLHLPAVQTPQRRRRMKPLRKKFLREMLQKRIRARETLQQ